MLVSAVTPSSPLSFRIRAPSSQLQHFLSHRRGNDQQRQRHNTIDWASTRAKLKQSLDETHLHAGYYYGIGENLLRAQNNQMERAVTQPPQNKPREQNGQDYLDEEEDAANNGDKLQRRDDRRYTPNMTPQECDDGNNYMTHGQGDLGATIHEFRNTADDLRESIKLLRQEIAELNRIQKGLMRQNGLTPAEEDREVGEFEEDQKFMTPVERRKRRAHFDRLGEEVEEWGNVCLFEENEEHGWKEVVCNKLLKKKYNANGLIKCFVKWMPDPRGKEYAKDSDKGKVYPCIKAFATIDAPLEDVCAFLADDSTVTKYNDLVENFRDLEDITPHSKICWGQCPQILFIKPRDFVNFCSHRWKRDGTQVVVNQAVDHEEAPAVEGEDSGKICRARSFRGANFISRDPNDPSKTRFALIAHADPGSIPTWACKTAVNALAPIEPFKLFHNLETGVKSMPTRPRADFVSSHPARSSKPGGLSQLGYACFWPNGGGLQEEEHKYDYNPRNQAEIPIAGEEKQNISPKPQVGGVPIADEEKQNNRPNPQSGGVLSLPSSPVAP